MAETGKPLSELRAMRRVPQVLENVRVRERIPLAAMPQVEQVIASVQGRLDGNGRLLVRRSEEHTSELQSHLNIVCRLLLEQKNYSGAIAVQPPLSDAHPKFIEVCVYL